MNKFAVAVRAAMVFCLVSIADGSQTTSLAPVGLLVNNAVSPLAIDRAETRFTWKSTDTNRAITQTAYRILVASSENRLASDTVDFWDSGKVDSNISTAIPYRGRVLPPATRFWWKVRTWDQSNNPNPYSAPSYFDTGLNQADWSAQFVWDGTTNQNNFAYFRKEFSLTQSPTLAKVYVTAHNDYLLYLNGKILGRGPARCDPVHYGQYNAYDITKLVEPGSNVLAAIGHWQGTWNNSGINAQPAFMLEARFNYRDGSASKIGTDSSWKVLANTAFIETNATYFGATGGARNRAAIQFDSRQEPVGWNNTNFNAAGWTAATVVSRLDYHLFAQMAPAENEQAELAPSNIISTNAAWLIDFGRCLNGWPKLTLHANHAGDIVRVEYYEMSGQRMPAGWDQYTCHGGSETWKPDFGRHTSFQVIKITGYAGNMQASDVRAVWAYSDADVQGRFDCSSSLLNSIYNLCERSARQNIQQGIISVDANREQSPWTADSWNIGNVLLYNDQNTAMMDKVVRDYAGEQLPMGDFPACAPAHRGGDYIEPEHASRRIPEWSMYWPMLLWQQYLFSGDETLLRTMAPHLTRFLQWLKTHQDPITKLINPPGWRISDYAGGNMPSGGVNITTECQYYENLRIASAIFSTLGQPTFSQEYGREANEVKTSINSNFFKGDFYLAQTDRNQRFPLASAWALRFDLEPPTAKAQIVAAIEKMGKPDIGGYGGNAFYSGMLNAGGGAFVVHDLARYRPMLEGNKANWEGFNTRGEVNHAWTSYPGYLFQKYICGIQPTSGGFATFDIRPETGGLTYASGTVPTVKGHIVTRWQKFDGGRFSLSIQVPANTQAAIYIPKFSSRKISLSESGHQLWPENPAVKDLGIISIRDETLFINCIVGSGIYDFVADPIRAN